MIEICVISNTCVTLVGNTKDKLLKRLALLFSMDPQELLSSLGLNPTDSKIYLALLGQGNLRAGILAKMTQSPRNKVYESLDRLLAKGLMHKLATKPATFSCASTQKLRDLVSLQQNHLQTILDSIPLLEPSSDLPRTFQDTILLIKGQREIVHKIRDQMKQVRQETLSSVRSLVDDPALVRLTADAIERGVRVRMICVETGTNVSTIRKFAATGAQIRLFDQHKYGPQSVRFSVFDDKACRFTIGKPEMRRPEDYLTIWSESPGMIRLLKRQFEELWKSCKPFTR